MKKLAVSMVCSLLFAFGVCLIVSVVMGQVPDVLEGQRGAYVFFRGLLFFLQLLPALIGTAFLVFFAIYFGTHAGSASERFSPAIFRHFKMVMITALVSVFVLALAPEIFIPAVHARQQLAEDAPHLLNEYLISGRYCYVIKNYYLAHEYGRQALKLDPGNKEAQTLIDDSERSLHTIRARVLKTDDVAPVDVSWGELQDVSVTSLLEKAREAYEAEKWFDAHYYAQLAVAAGGGKDINLREARELSARAWNRLNDSASLADAEAKAFFARKKKAYSYLVSGDNLEAYYEFLDMYNASSGIVDPDVQNYFDIAKERLTKEAFFIDETLHLQLFEASRNVYFSVPHADGSKEVVFIRGITTVSNSGRMIQYLRDFSLYTYDANGRFVRSVQTPYAKLVAEPVDFFEGDSRLQADIAPAFKNVPYLILRSVSREANRMKNEPVYQFATEIPEGDRSHPTSLVLAMPFDDFNLVCDAAVGAKDMNLLSLIKLSEKAATFGYPEEVFAAMLIRRLTYPLVMLIVLLFLASVAWNYRLGKKQVFKFTWSFVTLICVAVLYVLLEILLYVNEILCYALVGFLGQLSVIIAVLIYTVLFICTAVFFLARKTT